MPDPAKHPLVSICIPTYNRPDLLEKTLNCLTKQTYPNLEIVVSDNCSPDEQVRQVTQEFMGRDSRIKYFRQQENIGPFANFIFVRNQARGEFMMWSSDDHEFNSDHVEKLMAIHCKGHYNLVVSDWDCFSEDGTLAEFKPFPHQTMKGFKELAFLKYLLLQNWVYAKANFVYGIFRRNAIMHIELQHQFRNLGTDHLLIYEVMLEKSCYFLPEKTWRRHLNYCYSPTFAQADLTLKWLPYYYLNSLRLKKSNNMLELEAYTQSIHTLIDRHCRSLPRFLLHLANEINKLRMMTVYCR